MTVMNLTDFKRAFTNTSKESFYRELNHKIPRRVKAPILEAGLHVKLKLLLIKIKFCKTQEKHQHLTARET